MDGSLIDRVWGATNTSRRLTLAAIALYFVAGIGNALLAARSDELVQRIGWAVCATVLVALGATLAIAEHRRRR